MKACLKIEILSINLDLEIESINQYAELRVAEGRIKMGNH